MTRLPCVSHPPLLFVTTATPLGILWGWEECEVYGSWVCEKGERDTAVGQCVYAEINKQSNIHKLGTATEQFVSPKKQSLKINSHFLSLLFLQRFSFLWEDIQIQGHWQFRELEGGRSRKKADGCLTVEERRESPGNIKAICLLFAPNLFLSCWGSSV